jgi:hypothetical protein
MYQVGRRPGARVCSTLARPSTTQVSKPALGTQVAYAQSGGTLSQVLNQDLAPSRTYTLQVDVGDRLDIAAPAYTIALYAGGVLLAQATQVNTPTVNGNYVLATVVYTSPATVTPNQKLEIRLSGSGTNVNFDNVRLRCDNWDATRGSKPSDFQVRRIRRVLDPKTILENLRKLRDERQANG